MYYLDDIPQVLDGSATHSIDCNQNVATGKFQGDGRKEEDGETDFCNQ